MTMAHQHPASEHAPASAKDAQFPAADHDHSNCLREAIARARALCKRHGVRFTKQREALFAELASSHVALGAYELQARLAGRGVALAPMSIYRIIQSLIDLGLVHRLESRKAFFACYGPHDQGHSALVLVCRTCGRVAEMAADDIRAAIDRAAAGAGFQAEATTIEVLGLCPPCAA